MTPNLFTAMGLGNPIYRRNHKQAYGPSVNTYAPVSIGGKAAPVHISRGILPV